MAKTESKDLNNLESLLECPLCLVLICEPISIPCGHSFCRVCLVKSLVRHKKKCPTCRAVCHVSAESAEENTIIKSICVNLFSDIYNSRLKECESEKEQWSKPRYKLMMQRIVHANRCFAYVPNFTNYQAAVGDVALVASITEVEFMSDGRCLVEARLTERTIIIDHYGMSTIGNLETPFSSLKSQQIICDVFEDGTQGLHFCRVEPLKDEPHGYGNGVESDPSAAARLNAALQVCRNISDKLMSESRRQIEANVGPPPPDSDPEGFSLWLCSLSSASSTSKRNWLKMTSTIERLEGVMASFCTHAAGTSASAVATSMISVSLSAALSSITGCWTRFVSFFWRMTILLAVIATGSSVAQSSSARTREEDEEDDQVEDAHAHTQTDTSQAGNDDNDESDIDHDGEYTGESNLPFAPAFPAALAVASSGPVARRGSTRSSSENHSD